MESTNDTIVAQLERQLRSQQVNEAEDFATMIVQSTMDGIYTFDRDLTITLWNRAMERISGIKREQVVGHDIFLKFPFLLEMGLQALVLEPLRGNATPETEGPWHNKETGRRGYSRRRSYPLRNEAGEVVGGIVIVREISEQKKAQDEVLVRRRAEERLKFLSDAGMLLSSTLDYTTVIQRVIDLATRQFGAWCMLRLLENDGRLNCFQGHQDPVLAARFAEMERKYPPPESLKTGPLWVLKHGGHQFFADFRAHPAFNDRTDPEFLAFLETTKSYICVPLEAQGRIFGTYSLIGTERHFAEDDLRLAQDLARWSALAISNARLFAHGRSK